DPLSDLVPERVRLLDRPRLVLLIDLVVGRAHLRSIPRTGVLFLLPYVPDSTGRGGGDHLMPLQQTDLLCARIRPAGLVNGARSAVVAGADPISTEKPGGSLPPRPPQRLVAALGGLAAAARRLGHQIPRPPRRQQKAAQRRPVRGRGVQRAARLA